MSKPTQINPSQINLCKFIDVKKLGSGSYASISMIEDSKGNTYAYKPYSEYNREASMELPEIDIMFRIRCPYIASGISFFEGKFSKCKKDENFSIYPGIVMPVMKDLFKTSSSRMLTFKNLKLIMFQISMATKCLHDNKYLHLDIKLANILLLKEKYTEHYTGHLIDFGISAPVDSIKTGIVTDRLRITSMYRPLESYDQRSNNVYDGASDIWSLGVLFISMMAGNESNIFTMKSVTKTDPSGKKYTIKEWDDILTKKDVKKLASNEKYEMIDKSIKLALAELPKNELCTDQDLINFRDLVSHIFEPNNAKRPDISYIISHKFFDDVRHTYYSCSSINSPPYLCNNYTDVKHKGLSNLITILKTQNVFLNQFFFCIDLYMRTVLAMGPNVTDKELVPFIDTIFNMGVMFYDAPEDITYIGDSSTKFKAVEIVPLLEGKIRQCHAYEEATCTGELKLFYDAIILDKNNIVNYLRIDVKSFYSQLQKDYVIPADDKNCGTDYFLNKKLPVRR